MITLKFSALVCLLISFLLSIVDAPSIGFSTIIIMGSVFATGATVIEALDNGKQ